MSKDGSRLLYVAPGGTAGTFDYIEANIDLSNPVTLVTSAQQLPPAVAGDRFVVESAQKLADAGVTVSIDSFDDAGKRIHLSDVGEFTAAPASDTVLLYASKGISTVSASKGGTPVPIAMNTLWGPPRISPDGKYGVFVNLDSLDHSIWSFTMASPKPAALPRTNGEYVGNIFFSPDGSRFTVNNGPASLAVVSTTAGNQAEVDRAGYSYVGDVAWFTNDSRYMIVDEEPADGGVGSDELAAVPFDTLKITPIAKSRSYAATVAMTGASKIVFLTAADGLLVADAAKPDAPVSIAKDAQQPVGVPKFLLNAAGNGVVYVNGTDLLYVAVP